MPFYFVQAIGKSQVFKTYGTVASFIYSFEPVLADGKRGPCIRNIQRRAVMKVFARHKPEMLRDMVELEIVAGLPQLLQPILLFRQPPAGKKGEKNPVAD